MACEDPETKRNDIPQHGGHNRNPYARAASLEHAAKMQEEYRRQAAEEYANSWKFIYHEAKSECLWIFDPASREWYWKKHGH